MCNLPNKISFQDISDNAFKKKTDLLSSNSKG